MPVAPVPERPTDGGMATEAMIAHVLVSKFYNAPLLCRQSRMLALQSDHPGRPHLPVGDLSV